MAQMPAAARAINSRDHNGIRVDAVRLSSGLRAAEIPCHGPTPCFVLQRLPVRPARNLKRCFQIGSDIRVNACALDVMAVELVLLRPAAEVLLGRQHHAFNAVAGIVSQHEVVSEIYRIACRYDELQEIA